MARLAAAQHGVVTGLQLIACGVTRHAIDTGVRNGRLHRVHQGVYVVGHLALAPFAREQAALLAVGDGAVLSHASAAYLWNLQPRPTADVDVSVALRRPRQRAGIRLHRLTRGLDPRDVRLRHGLPVTSPARTVLDLASVLAPDRLEDALAEARVHGLLSEGQLEQAAHRLPTRTGARALRELLGREGQTGLTRSRAERRLLALIGAARLPMPVTNVTVAGYEVDALWADQRLIVEFDGFAAHGHRRAFERDRARDAGLVAAGYRVIRLTWRQLTEQPLLVIANLAGALAGTA